MPEINNNLVVKIKVYKTDHEIVTDLHQRTLKLFREMTMQELLREAIHAGLPAVTKRYSAAVSAAEAAEAAAAKPEQPPETT